MSSSSEYNSPVELISQVVLSNDQLATLLDDVEFNSPPPRATTAVKRTADQDKPPRFKIPKIVRTEPDEVISERPIISPTPLNNRVPQPIKTSTPKPSAYVQSTDTKPIQATPAYYALTYRGAKLEYDRKIIKLATEDKLSVFDIWRYFAKQTNAKLTICEINQLLRCAYCDQKHATTTECLMKFLSTTSYYVVNPKYQVIDFDRALKADTKHGLFTCSQCLDYGPKRTDPKDLFDIRSHIASHRPRKYLCALCVYGNQQFPKESFSDKTPLKHHLKSSHRISL